MKPWTPRIFEYAPTQTLLLSPQLLILGQNIWGKSSRHTREPRTSSSKRMGGGTVCSLTSVLLPRKPDTNSWVNRLHPLGVLVYVKVASLGQDPVSVQSDPLAGFSDLFNRYGCLSAFAAG